MPSICHRYERPLQLKLQWKCSHLAQSRPQQRSTGWNFTTLPCEINILVFTFTFFCCDSLYSYMWYKMINDDKYIYIYRQTNFNHLDHFWLRFDSGGSVALHGPSCILRVRQSPSQEPSGSALVPPQSQHYYVAVVLQYPAEERCCCCRQNIVLHFHQQEKLF